MQRDLIVKTRSLGGSSDLTLLAPIKPGFVESLESVTYKTRIKRVLETLHGARQASHEYATARLLSDSVERVGAIQSVRVAVLEPENKVLLAVTFDGSRESYIRVLWDKVGTLLDLIFCGTVDYVTAFDHTFDEWMEWADRVQVETGFFYGPPDFTARDVLYHRRVERMRGRVYGGASLQDAELNAIRAVAPSAEDAAQKLINISPQLPDDPPVVWEKDPHSRLIYERVRNGLQGLGALHRLADLHRFGTADGEVLRRAVADLLREFLSLYPTLGEQKISEAQVRFSRQLQWMFPGDSAGDRGNTGIATRHTKPASTFKKIPDSTLRNIQGGIVRPYLKVTHGAVLMLVFRTVSVGAEFLAWLSTHVSNGTHVNLTPGDVVFRNVGFTPAGLRAMGLSEDELNLFPEDFRQGMAARAGLLGDVRNNHPRRWQIDATDLSGVHAVLQMRCDGGASLEDDLSHDQHPLFAEIENFKTQFPDIQVLVEQSLRRNFSLPESQAVDHFGYVDGMRQPDLEPGAKPNTANRVNLGEIILGHNNNADTVADVMNPATPVLTRARLSWLADSSFLVVRKYRQFAHVLEQAVEKAAASMPATTTEHIYGKLMGRTRDGKALVPGGGDNNFLYTADPQGMQCPLNAHIRLANPRVTDGSPRPARLIRRGMSYGPPYAPGSGDDAQDRGMVFMAYNASISEQYEVVQRWLTGGNSTGSSSGQSCPFLGVPENGHPRHFKFEHNGQVVGLQLDGSTPLFEQPETFTRLEWGVYLFSPSISTLHRLHKTAIASGALATAQVPWETRRGRVLISGIQAAFEQEGPQAAAQAWKTVLEDPVSIDRLDSASVWAVIREDYAGVLKTNTSYGTIVASRELISHVLIDADEQYSVSGQSERVKASFGEIYLTMDKGSEYDKQAGPINQAINDLTKDDTAKRRIFDTSYEAASKKIRAIIDQSKEQSAKVGDSRFQVVFDAREVVDEVLGDLCEAWFGLQNAVPFVNRGGMDWSWKDPQPPLYPGHFTALSRYMFQPSPGDLPNELGVTYGKALRRGMDAFVADCRTKNTVPTAPDGTEAPIAAATFGHADYGHDIEFVSRTMIGVLMGFNPTIIGAILNVLREWHRDGTFGVLRAELGDDKSYEHAHGVIGRAMAKAARMRPMPQITWRTASANHRLGEPGKHAVDVVAGEKIVLGLVSGTQQSLADGQDDGRLMFGGKREAHPHPTHACPGYEAGIEAMVGTLTALLSVPEHLRQGSEPLIFVAEGTAKRVEPLTDFIAPLIAKTLEAGHTAPWSALSLVPSGSKPEPVREPSIPSPGSRSGLVFAWGDSWLDYAAEKWGISYPVGVDIRDHLVEFGYTVPDKYCKWTEFKTVEAMAKRTADFRRWMREGLETAPETTPALAVLLSAGGNDSTEKSFEDLLNKRSASVPVFDANRLKVHVAKLIRSYQVILDAIVAEQHIYRSEVLDLSVPTYIPIIIHGYDYPFPQAVWLFRNWFVEPFANKGYTDQDQPAKELALRQLIDEFNMALERMAQEEAYKPFVRYVKLSGTLENYWSTDNVKQIWDNDLHPHDEGFAALAAEVDKELQKPFNQP